MISGMKWDLAYHSHILVPDSTNYLELRYLHEELVTQLERDKEKNG